MLRPMPRKRKDADAEVTMERVEAYVRQSSAATRRPLNLADEQIPKENRRGRHGRGWLSRSVGRVADLAVFGVFRAAALAGRQSDRHIQSSRSVRAVRRAEPDERGEHHAPVMIQLVSTHG